MKACVTSKILSKDTSGKTVPFEETLQFVKQAGFEEIDMGLEAPALTGPGWESALYDLIRLCEREHIRIRYAHMPYHYPKPDDAKGWEEFYTATCRAIDFAKAAGYSSPVFLKLVCDSKANLSEAGIERVASAMGLVGVDLQYFRQLVAFNQEKSSAAKKKIFAEMRKLANENSFALVGEDQYD